VARHPWLVTSAVVLFVVLALSRVASLGGSFLPDFREGHFVLGVTATPGT
jgi:Cu/Ag efflux pump CusA